MTTQKETLITFDAIAAAKNPEALEHALNVISLARKTSPECQ